jgi:multisubunit Na+/H+ antiporter MnhG subunit
MFGAMIYENSVSNVLKILLILIICLVTSPLSTHATMLSAYDSGVRSTNGNK